MRNQISFILSAMLLAGCSDTSSLQGTIKGAEFMEGIYSTRPTVEDPFITIIKLKNPALLETAKKVNGKTVIDEKLLKAIQDEQEAAVKELAKISPDVRVLIRYKLVLNGFAIWAPGHLYDKLANFKMAALTEKSVVFSRPQEMDTEITKGNVGARNSVNFIGADAAYAQNIRGQGMRVGVIDTGIDFTHKMFLGEGTEEAYLAVKPSEASNLFPNTKIVGGIDLVGTEYNTGSTNPNQRIPKPDANPLDESGHGTHVAGSVAGLGDGVNTYDGVAPDADLYAIKVFGAKGSTSSEVVIAALEYSVDPSGDLSFDKQLDIVNLSLGSNYGGRHIMYNHAIANTVKGGTIVVASGGNSGDKNYIVGAPGVSEDAISVASSLDDSHLNVEFPAVEFNLGATVIAIEAIEADKSKPVQDLESASGPVIYAGLADKDFTPEEVEQLKGKFVLLDRGVVSFGEKAKRVNDAGALGMIVANNSAEELLTMGLGTAFPTPAVMISQKDGNAIKEALKTELVTVDLKKIRTIEKPYLADTISTFSSRGPRSGDGLIKPEISAPGNKIVSAEVGKGDKGSVKSGTSMAGPHIAGVMALLKQKFNDLSPSELKSVLLGHGKVISDAKNNVYTVSRQGAGRVQIAESLEAKVVSTPATLSLGITDLEKQKTMVKELILKNISSEAVSLKASFVGSSAVTVSVAAVQLAPKETKKVLVQVRLNADAMKKSVEELDGFVQFTQDNKQVLQLPLLAVTRKISQVQGSNLLIHATSAADSAGSLATVSLENKGVNSGVVYPFNLIATDTRKGEQKQDLLNNRNCDLQSAGYRLVEKDGKTLLQIGLKLFEGMTTWNRCEVNVQIDSDGDNLPDQEIAGISQSELPGLSGDGFVSLLLDGNKARQMRKAYEETLAKDPSKAVENYAKAVVALRPMIMFDNSTLAIIEADLSQVSISATGELSIKISTTHQDSGVIEYDDYLGNQDKAWHKISTRTLGQSFAGLPEVVTVDAKSSRSLELVKGYDSAPLVLYTPLNRAVNDILIEDAQSLVLTPAFQGGL